MDSSSLKINQENNILPIKINSNISNIPQNIVNHEHNLSLFKIFQSNNKDNQQTNHNNNMENEIKNKNSNSEKNSPLKPHIIKPKFVTKTIVSDNFGCQKNNSEDLQNQTIPISFTGSAFQPRVLLQEQNDENSHKNFNMTYNNKYYMLLFEIKNKNLHLRLTENIDNIYYLKYFYENNFSLEDLKKTHKFFALFDGINDVFNEIEKQLNKNKVTLLEDTENKIMNLHFVVNILENDHSINIPMLQQNYSKENLFESLCNKVSDISKSFESRIDKLEREKQLLEFKMYQMMNSINLTMMSNPPFNNYYNNNTTVNKNKNNKNNSKNNNIKEDESIDFNHLSVHDEENNENLDNNSVSFSSSSKLQKKRKRESPTKNNKKNNNNLKININTNITNNNINNGIDGDYYFLDDLKHKHNIKCKNLFEIIQTKDEFIMVISKILSKYKTQNNISSSYKLLFNLKLLFDSDINGDTAKAFHNKCDFEGNTISLILTKDLHRFGGYTKEYFESPENNYFDKKDNSSFVFSLDKMKTYDVIKDKYAISCDKNYGPYFRDDHICVVDKFLSNQSGTCIKGKNFYTNKNYELNLGRKYFYIKRLQVFQIKIKKTK